MKRLKRQYGLTLIELLIAVALVVILVSMTLMVTNKSYSDADAKAAEGTIALLDSALQEYHDYYNYFPVYAAITDPALTSDEERRCAYLYRELNSVPDSRKIIERISDSYIRRRGNFFIYIDSWGTVLDYIYSSDMNFPLIVSAGPDRNFGTADDITNKK